jgi:hypothetical protein
VRTHHAEHMGAHVFLGLLHELLEPSQGTLTLVEYSKRLCSGLDCQELWVNQVQHWHDIAYHLVALTFLDIPVLPDLERLR